MTRGTRFRGRGFGRLGALACAFALFANERFRSNALVQVSSRRDGDISAQISDVWESRILPANLRSPFRLWANQRLVKRGSIGVFVGKLTRRPLRARYSARRIGHAIAAPVKSEQKSESFASWLPSHCEFYSNTCEKRREAHPASLRFGSAARAVDAGARRTPRASDAHRVGPSLAPAPRRGTHPRRPRRWSPGRGILEPSETPSFPKSRPKGHRLTSRAAAEPSERTRARDGGLDRGGGPGSLASDRRVRAVREGRRRAERGAEARGSRAGDASPAATTSNASDDPASALAALARGMHADASARGAPTAPAALAASAAHAQSAPSPPGTDPASAYAAFPAAATGAANPQWHAALQYYAYYHYLLAARGGAAPAPRRNRRSRGRSPAPTPSPPRVGPRVRSEREDARGREELERAATRRPPGHRAPRLGSPPPRGCPRRGCRTTPGSRGCPRR